VESSTNSTPWYAESNRLDTAATGDSSEKPLMQQAKEQTQQVLHQTQQKAGQMVDQAKTQVMSQLEGQKERAAGTMESVAQALRQTGQQLRDQNQAPVAQFAEGAADFVERFTGYLNQRNVNEMIGEVERFARRQPALFLGGAFALGFLAARFLKSSSPYDGGMARQDYTTGYATGRYRADQQDLAYPVEVAGVSAAGAMGTGSAYSGAVPNPATGSTNVSPTADTAFGTVVSSPTTGTTGATTSSVTADVDDDTDLVTTTGPEDRSEVR